MKRKIYALIGLIVLLAAVAVAVETFAPVDRQNNRVNPGQQYTNVDRWVSLDTVTSAGTEPTALAADERTYQTVVAAIAAAASGDDEIIVYDIPRGWNQLRGRVIGVTDNGSVIQSIYLGTLGNLHRHADDTAMDCELSYLGQFTWTIGQQASTTSTYEMADTLSVSAGDWNDTIDYESPGNDRVAEFVVDLEGADLLVIVTTTASCDNKPLVKGY